MNQGSHAWGNVSVCLTLVNNHLQNEYEAERPLHSLPIGVELDALTVMIIARVKIRYCRMCVFGSHSSAYL